MKPYPPHIQTWLEHIRQLAYEIGPRGSTTEGERSGALYCQDVLTRLGYPPSREGFSSARSIFFPHLLASILLLAAFAVYPLGGWVSALLAALLSAVALGSDLMELGFQDNLLRRLAPKGKSQNVVALAPPAAEHRQDLVLIGHIDSQRTPLIFKSKQWVDAYKLFTTIAFVAFAVQTVLYTLGALTQWGWVWWASFPCALCAVLLAALCLQADSTPFTAGANDNASAVGLVLTLGERFLKEPLQHTRVWLVCTGCEEVQHYGAIDFFKRHLAGLKNPRAIAFEMLGCAGPAWLEQEGIIVPFRASPVMLKLAQETAAARPELGAYPVRISGGNTEMADALRNGVPAITLMGLLPNGDGPYWHMVEDTYDKMDPAILAKAYDFALEMIHRMDAAA
jgi:hypothetical protein